MGRKKKDKDTDAAPDEPEQAIDGKEKPRENGKKQPRVYNPEDSSSAEEEDTKNYDIDADVKQLCYTYKIDHGLMQRLNNVMMSKRMVTFEQDLQRLYEILKDAHTPAAMLNLKVKDMQKGTFVGKAKCGPKVREVVRKHRLDKGAGMKLEEAMSMREAMGKDVEKDIQMLDEHLAASNKPSALISMKLDSLRKGFNIGHCIYSREPCLGNQGPGVDGVVEKKGKKVLGYSDSDLSQRFKEQGGGGGGQLMDEATIKKTDGCGESKSAGRWKQEYR